MKKIIPDDICCSNDFEGYYENFQAEKFMAALIDLAQYMGNYWGSVGEKFIKMMKKDVSDDSDVDEAIEYLLGMGHLKRTTQDAYIITQKAKEELAENFPNDEYKRKKQEQYKVELKFIEKTKMKSEDDLTTRSNLELCSAVLQSVYNVAQE